MQKKIIASLLMTPMALSALADIDVTTNSGISNDNWNSESVTGDDLVKDGVVTGGIGIGSITQTIKVPCAGEYNLSFVSPENLKITVAGSGIAQEGTGNNTVTFTAKGAADVTITIAAADPAASFSFAAPTLKIIYNFAEAQQAMTDSLDSALTITKVDTVPNGRKAIADALTERGEALQKNRKSIEDQIAKIVEEKAADETDSLAVATANANNLKTYQDYELYANPNKIEVQINTLKDQSDALNKEIANFNVLAGLETTELPKLQKDVKAELDSISAPKVEASVQAKDLSTSDKAGAAAYVSSTCAAQADAVNADVQAYAAAINAAYSNLSAEFNPAKDDAALTKEIADLTATVAKAYQEVADYAALNGVEEGWKAKLNDAVYNAQDTIINIKSVSEVHPSVYSSYKTKWLTAIEDANNTAKKVFDVTVWGNATKQSPENGKAYTTATDSIKEVVAAANKLSGEQNGAMLAALEIYNNNYATYDTIVGIAGQLTLSETKEAEYKKVATKAKEALDAFKTVIETEYGKLDLQASDYEAEGDSLANAINNLEDFRTAILWQFNAQEKLNALKKKLTDNQKELAGDGVSATFLEDMFAKNIESLQAAVNAVTSETEGANVEKAIIKYDGYAQQVIDALTAAKTATTKFSTSIGWLKGLNTKQLLNDDPYKGYVTLQGEIEAYGTKDAEWKAEYKNVTSITDPQECYKAAEALGDSIATYDWSAKITSSFNAYINGLTQGQYNVADSALIKVIAAIPTLAGDKEMPYDKAKADLIAIKPKVAAAIGNTGGNEAKLKACNAVIAEIQTLWNNSIVGMWANVNNYNALIKSINDQITDSVAADGTPVYSPLTLLNNYITSDCGEAARKHYQDLSDGVKEDLETYKTELGELLDSLDVTANKSKYEGLINAQAAQLGTTGTIASSIKNNEASYKEEVASGKGTRQLIINLLAEIEKEGNASQYATEWTDSLYNLLDKAIPEVDKTRDEAYKEGKCFAQNSAILAGYDAISAKANDVLKAFSEGWNTLVYNHNMELLNGTAWNTAKANMTSTYVNAINAFNGYNDLPNKGYTSYGKFRDVATNNAYLFDLSTDTRTLIKSVEDSVSTMTAKGYAISELEFKTFALDKSDSLIVKMTTKVDTMVIQFDAAGNSYYNHLDSVFNQNKAQKEALLASYKEPDGKPSYTADQIKTFLQKYVDLEANAAKAKKACPAGKFENYKESVGYRMGYIANTLDSAININLNEQVIKHEWDPEYKKVMADFAKLEEKFEPYSKYEGFEASYENQYNAFKDNKGKAENLNETIANSGNLLDMEDGFTVIKNKINALNGYYSKADSCLINLEAAYSRFKTDTTFKDYLTESSSDLSALEKIITLGGPAKNNLTCKAAEDKVEGFRTVYADYLEYETPTDAIIKEVNDSITAAENAINAVCDLAYTAEKNWLGSTGTEGTLVQNLVIAYNNAYAEVGGEPREGITAEVEAARDGVIALPSTATVTMTPEQYYEKASALEASISNLTVELQTIVAGESKALNDAVSEFNKALGNAETEVDKYKKALNNDDPDNGTVYDKRVIDEYNPTYQTLLDNLTAIGNAFTSAGNVVIAQLPEFKKQLNAETAQLSGIQNDIDEAQDNSVILDDLTEELTDGIVADYNALKETAETYGVYAEFTTGFKNIDLVIEAINEDLNTRYEERELTADPKLDADLEDEANGLISGLTTQVNEAYAPMLRNTTKEELDKVLTWLNELKDSDYKIMPNATENGGSISEAYEALIKRWNVNNEALRAYPTGKDDNGNLITIDDITNEYNKITKEAQELLQTAMNNSYKLGDLNNDGNVTIADAQVMRDLIIDGISYADLLVTDRREAYAANIIGNDQIDIADYTALVNIILTQVDNAGGPNRVKAANGSPLGYYGVVNSIEATGSINVVQVAEENGIRTYAIEISNPEEFVAGQIDLRVDRTSRIVEVRGAERLSNHDVMYDNNFETTRVLITSLSNDKFAGTEGVTLFVDVDGHSGLGFENAIFADETAQAYTFGAKDPSTSGIDSIYEGAKAVKEAIYDAAGRAMNGIRRGLNIIRNSDGTVTKEMHK